MQKGVDSDAARPVPHGRLRLVRRVPRQRPPDRLPRADGISPLPAPHGTTIVALRTADGVVLAGDRRATMGNLIAQHDIEKVFVTDEYSVVGIAGTAGLAIELSASSASSLEHYEKIEGMPLSLDGKANRLATLLRGNLGLAMQGLAVVPLFAGTTRLAAWAGIFAYDVTGGRYGSTTSYAVGSGSVFARGSLKKLYRRDASTDDAVRIGARGALRRRGRRQRHPEGRTWRAASSRSSASSTSTGPHPARH